jgi:arabinofuranosyltransferase
MNDMDTSIGGRFRVEAIAAVVIGGFALTFFLANTFVPYYRPIDDAFISYRYSKQVVQGHGLVWNPGEPPVEGFTNFLLVVTEIPFIALGADPLRVARMLSVLCILAAAFLLYRLELSRPGVTPSKAWAAFAAALLLCVPFLPAHVQSGLETASFAFHLFLPCVFLFAFLRLPLGDRDHGRGIALLSTAGLTCWLSGLCRPEGFVISSAMLAVTFLLHAIDLRAIEGRWHPRVGRRALPVAICIALAFVLPTLAYHIWRYSYFGDLLPNSYYIKVAPKPGNALPGLPQLLDFVRQPAVLFLLALVLVRRRFSRLDLLALPAALFAATFYLRSENIMAFNHRFFVPYLPFLVVLASPSGARLISSAYPIRTLWVSALVAGFVFAFVLRGPVYRAVVGHSWPKTPSEEETHFMLGKRMASLERRTELLVVGPDAGAMPYFSDTKWLDPIGLNDNFIARHVRAPVRELIDYVFKRNPEIFILCKAGNHFVRGFPGPLGNATEQIYKDRRFERYAYVARYRKNSGGRYDYLFFARKDLPTLENVRHVVGRRH